MPTINKTDENDNNNSENYNNNNNNIILFQQFPCIYLVSVPFENVAHNRDEVSLYRYIKSPWDFYFLFLI